MKLTIVNTMLIVALCASLLAWYVDRNDAVDFDMTGTWYYPTPEIAEVGHREVLTIRNDGTFSKTQQYPTHTDVFHGQYQIGESGVVSFYVTDHECDTEDSATAKVDYVFYCRSAIDRWNQLVIHRLDGAPLGKESARYPRPDDFDIGWQVYSRIPFEKQWNGNRRKFQHMIERLGR